MDRMKKVIFKVLLLLSLSFVFDYFGSVASDITVEAAVKKPSVKETKKTLYLGDGNYQLKFKNLSAKSTIKYKSSNSKIALVTTKGAVKPKAIGTATITATVKQNKKTYNLKVSITVKNKALSSKEIYSKCGPSTVEISVTDIFGDEALGSGFFLGKGRIITNYHVIEGASKIVVTTYDKKKYEVKTIVGYDQNIDLAILEIDASNKGLTVSKKKVSVGEEIYTLGSPLGLTGTMTKGMVSTASRIMDNVDYIQIDAAISQGNSGGPLVNEYGEVIGVNTMYFANGQNLNFAINIKELEKVATNNPLSVTDYATKYMNENFVIEDPVASKLNKTCQEVPSGTGVIGSLKALEEGDCYYFKVTEASKFYGILMNDTIEDLSNTYFVLYTYDDKELEVASKDPAYLVQYMEYDLPAGVYIIYVAPSETYTGNDINYIFTIFY